MEDFPCKTCVVRPVCNPTNDEYPSFNCNANQKQITACAIFQEWTSRKIAEYVKTQSSIDWRINELNR